MQCEVWKDEVQNLLIFAGLFSAVVTAFIIESYKALTPDPNDAIIFLLSVIAARLDNNTNSTPLVPPSPGPRLPFSPTMASIRINIFWFISLVLSLATVLVGIVSLQWIREHQNYRNLSPKESFGLFNMRADGLKKWHIPKVFTALPLLLQSALILFLGGIIDFLSTFGDISVVIPVSIVAALILLFLVATTVLPTLQGIFLCFPNPNTRTSKILPTQCPYKSPQAQAFHAVLSSTIRLCVKHFTLPPGFSFGLRRIDIAISILAAWTKSTWTGFDLAWLQLRDQFLEHSYHPLTTHFASDEELPIFDLSQALMTNVHSGDIDLIQTTLAARCHCFAELSTWVTNRDADAHPQAVLQANAYLRDLMSKIGIDCSASLSSFYDFTALDNSADTFDSWMGTLRLSKLLHQENMMLFFRGLHGLWKFDKTLKDHMLEVEMRLSTWVHMEEYKRYPTATWPKCLSVYEDISSCIGDDKDYDHLFWQWVNNFSIFFQGAARVQSPYAPGRTLHTYPDTVNYINASANVSLHKAFSQAGELRPAIQEKFIETFQRITDDLTEQMSTPGFREPNLMFYLTALYLRAKRDRHEPHHICLDDLRSAMQAYKERTIDAGVINHDLEEIYQTPPGQWFREITGPAIFSPLWWDFLKDPPDVGSSRSRISRFSIQNTTSSLHHPARFSADWWDFSKDSNVLDVTQ